MKRFILIDGNAIMHRAFHALPNFTTSRGEPVGAVYGFVSMFLRVISDLKPTYLAVAFDRAKPTFRQQLYVGYQATRPKMDDGLSSQFAKAEKVLEALNIPIFGVEGYEADDVIGTIALRATSHAEKHRSNTQKNADDIEVIIISGDRDLLQLVNSHVKVYIPIKGLTEAKLMAASDVLAKYGLTPSQIIDLKALMGDASDNYPGVLGVGPKTAIQLLQKYKTLEEIYKHLSDLPPKLAKALAEGAEAAGLGKKLATIVTDVPLQFAIEACSFAIKNKKKAVNAFRELEFKTLTNRLLELLGEAPKESTKKEASTLKIKPKPTALGDQLRLV